MASIIVTLDALLEPIRSERLPDFAPAYTSTPESSRRRLLKRPYMKTTKAFRLQEVRQSHTDRIYGRDRILDADIRGFFDAIDHGWLMKSRRASNTAPVSRTATARHDLR